MKEECELFFSFFVHDPNTLKFHHLHNRETAMNFWRTFSTTPNGGETRVGLMIDHIGKQIAEGKLHNLSVDISKEKVEALVINDGQDSIKTDAFSYKTNAITLIEDNGELKKLCRKNKGKYIHITRDDKVITDDTK